MVTKEDEKGSIVDTQKIRILDILDKYDISLSKLTSDAFEGGNYPVDYMEDLTFNQAEIVIKYVEEKCKPAKPYYFE